MDINKQIADTLLEKFGNGVDVSELVGILRMSMDVTGQYHVNRPDLWPYDTVIEFSGKLRGYRKKGTITQVATTTIATTILPLSARVGINATGGTFRIGDGETYSNDMILGSTGSGGSSRFSIVRGTPTGITLETTSNVARTNAPYEVWVLYEIA